MPRSSTCVPAPTEPQGVIATSSASCEARTGPTSSRTAHSRVPPARSGSTRSVRLGGDRSAQAGRGRSPRSRDDSSAHDWLRRQVRNTKVGVLVAATPARLPQRPAQFQGRKVAMVGCPSSATKNRPIRPQLAAIVGPRLETTATTISSALGMREFSACRSNGVGRRPSFGKLTPAKLLDAAISN